MPFVDDIHDQELVHLSSYVLSLANQQDPVGVNA